MGKINIRAKAARASAKLKAVQQRSIPLKAKTKADLQSLLVTTPSSGQSKVAAVKKTKNLPEKLNTSNTSTEKPQIKRKLEKLRQKRSKLMNKFELIKEQAKEDLAQKKRAKTAVVGDMKPLKDALPSLDELFELNKNSTNLKTAVTAPNITSKKLNVKQKIRQKKQKLVRQVNSFKALLKDADFKQNPRDAIAFHIKYKHGLLDE